jgi:effector-binding domain-containing protein
MFNKIAYSIVIAIFIFVALGLFLPGKVHVERHIEIQRPASTVYTVLNSYRTFTSWSPWSQRDPGAVYEYSGPERGRGAKMSWSGDPRLVGSGWQEITESQPFSLVRMHLEFDQQGTANSYFQIDEKGDGVALTWGFDADLLEGQGWFGGLVARYFGLFFDTWIGSDYEAGLVRLKTLLESMPAADFSDLEVEVIEVRPEAILYVSTTAASGSDDLASSLAAGYREIIAFMTEHGIEMAAQPLAITRIHDDESYHVEAAIPVRLEGLDRLQDSGAAGRVRVGRSPAGRALRVIHHGPYDRMAPTYERLAAWMAAHGMAEGRAFWEQYISDPGVTADPDLVTHIYFLLENES